MRLLVLLALALCGCASWGPAISLEPPKARALCCLHQVDSVTTLEVCGPPGVQMRQWCLAQERTP